MAINADNSALGLAVALGVSNTMAAWSMFAPSLTDLREGESSNLTLMGNLRHAEFCSTIVAGGVAAAVSLIIGSVMPLLMAGGLLTVLIVLSEYTLYHRPFGPYQA